MIYNQGFGGGMKPKIIVTAPTGTVVTATKGTTVITASESSGKYVILADAYGFAVGFARCECGRG